jgi:hypothetical protein
VSVVLSQRKPTIQSAIKVALAHLENADPMEAQICLHVILLQNLPDPVRMIVRQAYGQTTGGSAAEAERILAELVD